MKKVIMFVLCSALLLGIVFPNSSMSVFAEETGTFKLLTYNVAGLSELFSSSNPSEYSIQISPRLNDYDIVLVQEDWNYHDDIIAHVNHPYLSPHSGINGIGDGLNRMSMYQFYNFTRETWDDSNGIFSDGSDSLAPKGFSFARHKISDDVYVDIYNIHADAGGSSGDYEARKNQFQQLIPRINQWSQGNAVIVTGDTNSNFKDEDGVRQLLEEGFLDAEIEILHDGYYPEIGEIIGESIDKVIYRNGDYVQLEIIDFSDEGDNFKDSDGNRLSDHNPRMAEFLYTVDTESLYSNVAFFSAHNTYLVAESAGGSDVNADRSNAGAWETFTIAKLNGVGPIKSGDTVAIRTGSGHYLRATSNGALDAEALSIGTWEQFTLINHSNPDSGIANGDQISFKSVHGKHIVAESDGDAHADRTDIGSWEKFIIEKK